MIFKEIRYLIYSPLELIIEDKHLEYVDVQDEFLDQYDYYEVIGIRSSTHNRSEYYYESNVVISLKPTITKISETFKDYTTHKDIYMSQSCKED